MSKKDYTKFSKNRSEDREVVENKPIPEVTYPFSEDDVSEEPDVIHTPEQKPLVFGKVSYCSKLNVREHPTLFSDVLCCLIENTEIEIDKDKSTSDFYAICTPTGLEGFCLKKFVEICK